MKIVWAALIVVAVMATTVRLMLIVRRGAPERSYIADGDRAAEVFGVLATGFSVLLGSSGSWRSRATTHRGRARSARP
mgnify:CR=1 FL=1